MSQPTSENLPPPDADAPAMPRTIGMGQVLDKAAEAEIRKLPRVVEFREVGRLTTPGCPTSTQRSAT